MSAFATNCRTCGELAWSNRASDARHCTGYRGEYHTYRCTCPCHYVTPEEEQ